MKKQILTKIIATIVLATTLLLVNVGGSKAVLQANQNTQYNSFYNINIINAMKRFREMEKAGEAMGLDETLNEDLTPEKSNNIDVHMMRSTEYGAIAILSASGYGNPDNKKEITTTTGNKTGIMLNIACDNVVAGAQSEVFGTISSRYYDTYIVNDLNSSRAGDALGNANCKNPGCLGWHSAGEYTFINVSNRYLVRGGTGIFAYSTNANSTKSEYYRGVAVCGEGF